jgi:hypothetical protein
LEDFLIAGDDRLRWVERRAAESARFREALRRAWVWDLPPHAFDCIEQAAGAPLRRRDESVIIEVVPGDVPGTVHIQRNGVTVDELETEPEEVEGIIDLMRRFIAAQEKPAE